MSTSTRARSYAVAQVKQVCVDFKQSDFMALEQVASKLRVALELVSAFKNISSKNIPGHPVAYFSRFTNRYVVAHERKWGQANEVLGEVLQGAIQPQAGQDLHSMLNLYLLARVNTRDAALQVLARVQKLILMLWQAGGRPNIDLQVSGHHPARSCRAWIRYLREYLTAARRCCRNAPYGDSGAVFSAALTKVALRTLGTLPGRRYQHEKYVFDLVQVTFTETAITKSGSPAVDAAVGTGKMPTGSILSPGIVLKHVTDLGNLSWWVVDELCAGGSVANLRLVDTGVPSRLKRTSINNLHVANIAIQFYAVENGAEYLRHRDLYRLKFVLAGKGAAINTRTVFRVAGGRERSPQYNQRLFRRTERRPKDVDSIAPSYGELKSRSKLLLGHPGRRSGTSAAVGNFYLVIVDTGAPGALTVTARTGLDPTGFQIRISTIFEHFVRLGELGGSGDPFTEFFIFGTADENHNHLKLIHDSPITDHFNVGELYEDKESLDTQPSTQHIQTWPTNCEISFSSCSGKIHSDELFSEREALLPPTRTSAAAATTVSTATSTTGIVLDPIFAGLDIEQIALDLDLPGF